MIRLISSAISSDIGGFFIMGKTARESGRVRLERSSWNVQKIVCS
jgi:hypothetical protein